MADTADWLYALPGSEGVPPSLWIRGQDALAPGFASGIKASTSSASGAVAVAELVEAELVEAELVEATA